VGTYVNDVAVDVIGLSQAAAPAGTVVLVVVWVPLIHTHRTVSPIFMVNEAGVKTLSDTCTVCIVPNELNAKSINTLKKSKFFFIVI
jgi:hypothetical protein